MKLLKILISILFVLSLCSCQAKPSEANAISESYQSALSSIEFTVNEQLDMIDYVLSDECDNYFNNLNIDGILAESVEQYTYDELEEYLEEDSKNIAYLKEELSNASSNISELKTEIEELKREYELELENIREEYKEDN